MTRTALALAISCGAAAAALASPSSSRLNPPSLTLPRASVNVLVTVVDSGGSPMTGLSVADFRATSDERELTIAAVSAERMPLSLAVLLDATASAAPYATKRTKQEIAGAIEGVFRDGGPAHIWIGGLAATMRLHGPITSATPPLRPVVEQALDWKDEDTHGPSPLWDAIWDAARALSTEPGQRAMVIITDGKTSGNVHGFSELLYRMVSTKIAASVISEGARQFIPQGQNTAITVRPDARLRQLAEETGGAFYTDELVRVGTEIGTKTGPLVARLVKQRLHPYVLTLAVDADNVYHRLAVTVSRSGATVHAPGVFLAK